MFGNMSIAFRYQIGVALTIVVALGIVLAVTLSHSENTLHQAEQRELERVFKTFSAEVANNGNLGQAMAELVAGIPDVEQAFAAGDREKLQAMFAPGFEKLKKVYGVRQFQFHLPPATSFLRVHKLNKFGDDLSSFRKTVVETNSGQQPVMGVERGVAGLGIRGVVPVFNDGKHIGSVEFGMSLDEAFLKSFKERHGVDVAIYLNQDGEFKSYANTTGTALLGDGQLQQAYRGEPVNTDTHVGSTELAIYGAPLKDFSDNPVGVVAIAIDSSYFDQQLDSLRNTILFLAVIALVAGLVVAQFSARSIVRPIRRLTKSMAGIAEGEADLTQRLHMEGAVELAELATNFNRFVERIQTTVAAVIDSVHKLAATVDDFSTTAEQTNRGMQRQEIETTQIATAMNEMSSTVHEVANNTNQAAGAAAEADEQAASGHTEVNATIASINDLAKQVETAAQVIGRLNADSAQISTILDVIKGIAEQTNLLALNAAIEAARAGEQGRGFAVVADEVRTLAQRTQKSTQEIHDMIERLQHGASQAVAVMEEGRKRTQASVEQAARAGDALQAITRSVDTINDMSSQIASASEQQSSVAEEINRNIHNITQVAEETAAGASHIACETETLAELIQHLSSMLGEFRVGDHHGHDFGKAKSAHLAWKVKLRGFLDGRQSLSKTEAVSDHDCVFGKWYFGEGLQRYGDLPEMKEIQGPHEELHRLIKQIIAMKERGDMPGAEKAYQRVQPLSERIVALIERIEKKV